MPLWLSVSLSNLVYAAMIFWEDMAGIPKNIRNFVGDK